MGPQHRCHTLPAVLDARLVHLGPRRERVKTTKDPGERERAVSHPQEGGQDRVRGQGNFDIGEAQTVLDRAQGQAADPSTAKETKVCSRKIQSLTEPVLFGAPFCDTACLGGQWADEGEKRGKVDSQNPK